MPKRARKEQPVEEPKSKLFHNLLKNTKDYFQGKSFKPATGKQLREKLNIPDQHNETFREVLKQLVTEDVAIFQKMKYHCKKSREDIIVGILSVHPRGFAFLAPEKGSDVIQDVFIPKHFTKDAIDGDTVEVQVNRAVISDKGPEGKVIQVLQRGRTHLAGVVKNIDAKQRAWVYVPLLGENRPVYIDEDKGTHLKVGDRVVMAVRKWGEKETPTICSLKEVIGHISDPSCDVPAAIEEFEIRDHFPHTVIEEAEDYGKQVTAKDLVGRLDLRDLETFTIDPTTAKDFDDALSLSKTKKGHYKLAVHIADVSHYVKDGTALDTEARHRCNSTYFPGRVVPMLPPVLSDNLCSLRANVNRLTVSVLMEIDKKGKVVKYEIAKSVIRSDKRFTYEEAKEVLDGKRRSKHAPTLELMVELCRILKKQRYDRGSIEFSLSELVVHVDEKGVPQGTKRIEYDVTHQLVEEFMLKANELVATHLFKEGKGVAYRVHDQPATDNIREFVQICNAFGFKIPSEPTPADFQKLFDEAMKSPIGEYLANAYIRRMRLAIYSEENIGHYGLSLDYYCHFTSPIRRYVDLVIHRSLFEEGYSNDALALISNECSEQERVSARAEQNVTLLKKLRWLDQIKKDQPFKQYEAVITKVKPFGMYFEVLEIMLEGFTHISNVGADYYIFDESQMQLRGRQNNEIFKVGDKLTVMLTHVDCVTLESKWDIVSERPQPRKHIDKFQERPRKPKKFVPKKHHRGKKGRR